MVSKSEDICNIIHVACLVSGIDVLHVGAEFYISRLNMLLMHLVQHTNDHPTCKLAVCFKCVTINDSMLHVW